jgi:hypothetical protein
VEQNWLKVPEQQTRNQERNWLRKLTDKFKREGTTSKTVQLLTLD